MCKSISILANTEELTEQFHIDNVLFYVSNSYEIIPTQSLSAVVVRDNKRMLDEFRWGLMPFWGKDSVWMDSRSMTEKGIYRRIVKRQRCVIPCSGFYVTRTDKKRTQWINITMRTGTFGIAGLYDVWRSASGEEVIRTVTMLMTEANAVVAPYQERMPSILEREEVDLWLEPELKDPAALKKMLRPMDELRMRAYSLASPDDKYSPFRDLDAPHPELA